MQTVYEAAGGDSGLLRLATAWHRRVMADEVVSHAFSHGFHPQHSERLAAYWAEALGGPPTYSDTLGEETSVVRMHSGNGEHHEMDRRAIVCFDQALTDVGLAENRRLRQVLHTSTTSLGPRQRPSPLTTVPLTTSRRPSHPALVMGRTPGLRQKHTAGLGPASSCVAHVAFPIAIVQRSLFLQCRSAGEHAVRVSSVEPRSEEERRWTWDPSLYPGSASCYTVGRVAYPAEVAHSLVAARQLNKGESLHALRRDLFFAHQGHIRRRHLRVTA
ncbi:MAG: hypothetical protein ACR2JG_10705 [Geodermatophilaceae bacterium]